MEEKLLENYKRYLERISLYKRFGYNVEEERRFILRYAYPIYRDILEVGTGKGYFTVELAKKGYEFVSVDISSEEQEFARMNIRYFGLEDLVNFRIEDAEHLSFDDAKFNIIFSVNTIHHLANPINVIDELIRVVTLEGKIIISDFTKEGLEIIDKIHATEGRIHEAGKTNLTDIRRYLVNKGFRIQNHKNKFQEILIACQSYV